MIPAILMAITILFILVNLYHFFTNRTFKKSYFSSAMFYKLFYTMLGLTIGFAVLYYALSYYGTVLVINDPTGEPADRDFLEYLYFSGVTMLSVGYGDFVPVGSARLFALIQAALGVLLPTACFMKALTSSGEKGSGSNS